MTITINELLEWGADQTPTKLGQMGFDTTTGRPRAFISGDKGLAHTEEVVGGAPQSLGVDGSQEVPTYSFANFTDRGMFAFGSGLGFSASGILRASISTQGVQITRIASNAGNPMLAAREDTDTGLFVPQDGGGNHINNNFAVSTGAVEACRWDASQVMTIGDLKFLTNIPFVIDPANGAAFFELPPGASAAVSPAGQIRLINDGGVLKKSESGAAYVAV